MFTSTLSDFLRQCFAALRILAVFTIVLGIGYPLAVWGVGRSISERADGQPLSHNGHIVGSALLGQDFTGEQWFHSRPSVSDYNSLASGASNLGPLNPTLLEEIMQRRKQVAATEGVSVSQVPADAVTASASGLDPQISPAYAQLQAPRVAKANGLPLDTVEKLISANTQGRFLGFAGEPGVNVVTLNLAIAQARR